MDFPKLTDGQHAVADAEVCTGIVLGTDRQRYLGSGEVWRIFDSLEAAQEFATAEVASHPSVECVIHDAAHRWVRTIRNEQFAADLLVASETQRQKPWWQFWKS